MDQLPPAVTNVPVAPPQTGQFPGRPVEREQVFKHRTFTEIPDRPGFVYDQDHQLCIDAKLVRTNDADRGRTDYGQILQLADSILRLGMLSPVKVRPVEDGKFELVAGGRRYRAFLTTLERYLPCSVQAGDGLWSKESELEENTQRKDLDWPEQTKLFEQIDREKRLKYGETSGRGKNVTLGWSTEKTAALVNEDESSVSKKIKMGKKLRERPELAQMLGHLPFSAAVKQLEKLETNEAFHKKHKAGLVSVSADVRLCSCLDGVDSLADSSVAFWPTDPPFGNSEIEQQTGSARTNMVFTGLIKESDNLDAEKMQALLEILVPKMSKKMVLGGFACIFFAFEHYHFLTTLLRSNGWLVQHAPLIWSKGAPKGVPTGYSYPSSYEPILFCQYKEKSRRLNGDGLKNVLECPPVPVNQRLHSFQKPTKLLSDLINTCSQPGDLVVDTFAGSGAVVKTAKLLNRNGLGFEIDKDNWASAQRNLLEEAGR